MTTDPSKIAVVEAGIDRPDGRPVRHSYCLFQDPWWLNIATNGNWDEVVVGGADVLARLPFYEKRRYGFRAITQPHLTPHLGPWFGHLDIGQTKRFSEMYALATELVARLPQNNLFRQNFCPEIINWLPFQWAGFSQQTRYTYRLEDLSDLDGIWAKFREPARRAIRKAKREVEVVVSQDVDLLCAVQERTFAQQTQPMPYRRDALFRIAEGALQSGHARFTFARDDRGNIHAINLIVFDDRAAYYLVGGSDSRFRTSGAASLLMWDAIQFAAGHSAIFDFEGSVFQGIERFFRGFNPTLTPFHRIYRLGRLFGPLRLFRDAIIAMTGQPPRSM